MRLHVGQAVTVLVAPAFRAIAFEDAVVDVCDDELAGTLAGSAVNTLDAVVPVADEFKAADTYKDGRWCGCCAGYVLRLHVASVWGFGGETHRSPFTRREGADGDRQNPGGTSKTKEANASVPRDSMLFAGARIALAKRCVCDPQHSAARHRVRPAWTPALRHIVF